jgi:NADPH:quinone reductase-like Zn-dependent oxidoreductase
MKVVRLGDVVGLDHLRFGHEAEPAPPVGDEVLVRVHGSSLNYHDLNVAVGRLPSAPGRVLLTDGAGVVEAVGEDVAEFQVGDRVVSCFFPQWLDGAPNTAGFALTPGDGVDGYARDHVVRPAHWFTRAPRHLDHVEAATLTTAGLTAWRALTQDGPVGTGDSVLLLGTGGVSVLALQLAKSMGATVIVTSSSDEKLERAKSLGADHVVNYRRRPAWGKEVLEMTDGRGVDRVVEVGGPGTLAQSIAACRVGGDIALIGVLTGIGGEVPTAALMTRQQRLLGVTVGSRRQQRDLVAAIDASGMRPFVDRTFPLEAIADGFRYEQSGQHFGKIGVRL